MKPSLKFTCKTPSLKFTFEKEKKIVYHFSTLTWNEQSPASKLVCMGNLLLLDNTYVGNLSVPINKK